MTKSILLPLLALGAFAPCVRADDEPSAETNSPAAQLERTKRLMEKFQPSIVRVLYRFKLDDSGEEPLFRVFYTCPHCANKHLLDAEHYMSRDTPFEAVGFVLAPDRVLLQDLHVPSKWVASIQVGFNGALYDAKEVSRYPAEGGLLLATDRPLEGARPLAFDGEGLPQKPAYFFAVTENGLTVSGIKGPQAVSFKHYGEAGKDVYDGPANTILVDEKNRAVTVSLQEKVELGRENVAPPARWRSEGANALDERHEAVRKRLAASVLPIYIRLESKAQNVRRYGGDNNDEINAIGFALKNGEVLVTSNLSSENAARLNLVQHVAGDGSRTTLSFVGAFDEWGAFLARFPDGRLPAGVEPVAFSEHAPSDIFLSTVYAVGADNHDDKIHLSIIECRLDEFTTTWGGSVVPDVELGTNSELGFCCDAQGVPLAVQLHRRQSQRWSSREFGRSGGDIAKLLAERAFNPEYAPRVDTDRNRVAWIGVDVMRLTVEVAREKKVTSLLRHNEGSLVTRVYPGSPAAAAGIKEGDILISVRPANSQTTTDLEPARDYSSFDWSDYSDGEESEYLLSGRGDTPWPAAEGGINQTLTRFGIGAKVVVAWASNGTRRETEMTLERLPVHFNSARRSRNRDIGMTVCDMTYEVRNYFRLGDGDPGVVVAKLKSGDPAAVAGLRPFEIITEVNGRKVFSAHDFADATRGVDTLTFSVRRLTATRVVRISK